MKLKIISIIGILLVLNISLVKGLEITKDIKDYGEVELTIISEASYEDVKITEFVPYCLSVKEISYSGEIKKTNEGIRFIQWEIDLEAGNNYLSYVLERVYDCGSRTALQPTRMYLDSEIELSNDIPLTPEQINNIEENRCTINGKCEYPKENHDKCPQDCLSGGKDGYCDGLNDIICDPDCSGDTDPDCKTEEPGVEPQDWEKWIYIDFKEDEYGRISIEDIMTRIELPSTSQPSGDYYLEFMMKNGTVIREGNFDITKGEIALPYSSEIEDLLVKKGNEELLRFDLKQALCNQDGTCDESENYFSCPDDCTSGSDDGVCDGIKDGIIDPDCRRQEKIELDPDYSKPKWWKWPAIAVGLVLLIVIGVLVMFWNKRE